MSQINPGTFDPSKLSQQPGGPTMSISDALRDPTQRGPILAVVGLTVLLVLAYWDMFVLTSAAWENDLYSHGWIVPVFALGLLWMRWEPFRPVRASERWIGLAILAVGLLMRLGAVYFRFNPGDRLSFLPCIFGVFVLVGGWHAIRWAGPALGFLIFMFPLPSVLERVVLLRLQTLASICSTFLLQTMGVAAFREGNVLNIAGENLFVADACSGLRMLTVFCALAVAMVFLIERPWWDKFIILLSAVPIALAVNIVRITLTGLLYMLVGPENHFVQNLGHAWAGYFMMPLALVFLWVELQILEQLTIPVEMTQVKPVVARSPIPVR
jgi:exosortase